MDQDETSLHYFDAEDLCLESPGKAFHLNVDVFRKAAGVKDEKEYFVGDQR